MIAMPPSQIARAIPPTPSQVFSGQGGTSSVQQLFSGGTTQRLRKRQQILFDGAGDACLFMVQQGLLATSLHIDGDRRCLIDLHFPGDVISSERFARSGVRVFSLTQSQVQRVAVTAIERQGNGEAGALRGLMSVATRQAEQARLHCALLTRLTGEERLATLLVQLAQRLGQKVADRVNVPLAISREDIADYLGLNADTVSRIFTRFRKAKLIEFHGRSDFEILNWPKLCELSPLVDDAKPRPQPAR
ncbi:MAG: Crp/Fnr family transcriptional regulator [Hyphomicrobiales bacterium]|nr:MAG: Crp/Fnr family transcriptional regulator [Hyphomicrobiales bacterium]